MFYRDRCRKRLRVDSWEHVRTDRLVSEFLLNRGLLESADLVAQKTNLTVDGFDDNALYKQMMGIEAKLVDHSTAESLLWCFENRPHLKKIQSPLEFHLRRQSFVELARKRDLQQAIAYAKKFFPPWLDAHRRDIEKCMALLAIGPSTRTDPYRVDHYCWLLSNFFSFVENLLGGPMDGLDSTIQKRVS